MADRRPRRARRSCLTVPGSSEKMATKATTSAADMVILDLEDAVAPSEKEPARRAVATAVAGLDWGERVVGVRVNDWTSPWTLADVQAIVAGGGGRLDVVVLPKSEDAAMVRALDLVLAQVEAAAGLPVGAIGIDAQIESAAGVQQLADICAASPRMRAVTLGPLDLAASLGMPSESSSGRRRFDSICSAMVVAARAAGLPAGAIGIDAQIESAAGVQHLTEICAASPRMRAVTLGPLDLAASLGMPSESTSGRRRFDSICSAMVVAARAAGTEALDGPYVEIRDLDGLGADAAWAAEAGFDGKWVLHPDQIASVNAAFTPSAAAVERAMRILAAYDAATGEDGRGAILIDGEMVDEATCRIARRVVERSRGVHDEEMS